MEHLRKTFLAVLAAASVAVLLPAQAAKGSLAQGIELFNAGSFAAASQVFKAILADPASEPSRPAATLYLAKAAMGSGDLEGAESSLALFLSRYPRAADYPEALYQKGRLQYMQGRYEAAVQSLQGFLAAYPKAALVANAYFWAAESLSALGRAEDALAVYQKVVRDYPSSFKAEAAQYRASLIELGRREAELAKLLKWSHEEYLRNIGEYQRRERAYEQAIEAYQKRLAASSSGQYGQYERQIAELRAELERKTAESEALSQEYARAAEASSGQPPAQAPLVEASTQPLQAEAAAAALAAAEAREAAAAAALARLARDRELVDLKAEALALKEQYLELLLTGEIPAAEGGPAQ